MKSISKLLCSMTAFGLISISFADDGQVIMLKRKPNGELVVANDQKGGEKVEEKKEKEEETPAKPKEFSWFSARLSSLAAGAQLHSGTKLNSFSGVMGYFVENTTLFGNSNYFALAAKGRMNFASGSVTFTDGATQTYSFMFLGAHAGIGARLYAVINEKTPIKPFFEGYGLAGFGALRFNSNVNNLQPTGISLGFGYEIGGGIEFLLSPRKGSQSDSISVKFNYIHMDMNLAGKAQFQTGGFGIGASYNW